MLYEVLGYVTLSGIGFTNQVHAGCARQADALWLVASRQSPAGLGCGPRPSCNLLNKGCYGHAQLCVCSRSGVAPGKLPRCLATLTCSTSLPRPMRLTSAALSVDLRVVQSC